MRQCKQCEYEGPKETFPKSGKVNGVQYYRHRCPQCYVVQKSMRRQLLRAFLDAAKKEVQCVRCGIGDWRVLDWHHQDPNTKDFILADAARAGYSIQRIQDELDKCTALCANCHRIVEHEIKSG